MGRFDGKTDLKPEDILVELYANELSMTGAAINKYDNIRNLSEAYFSLKKVGYTSCYMSADDYNTLATILRDNNGYRDLLHFFYSFFHAPFESSSDVEKSSEVYLSNDWKYKGVDCIGIAMSYMMDSISLSIDEDEWGEYVDVYRNNETISVRNVSSRRHVLIHAEWIESKKEITLVETDVSPDSKPIHLRDDHGKDKLYEFAKKIVRSPYVVSVPNSMRFHPEYRKFIYDVSDDGIVKVVLNWTSAGYGMVIKTTGRNIRETTRIAELLEERFG